MKNQGAVSRPALISVILLLLVPGLLGACTPTAPVPAPSPCPAIQNGLDFLNARYNPTLGLINEAPQAAAHIYWLTNDNALAAFTLAELGQAELSGQLQTSLVHYGYTGNGLIEVVWGSPVSFPPLTGTTILVEAIGEDEIKQESHTVGEPMPDWADYTNLAFLGVLNHDLQKQSGDARQLYKDTLLKFDGTGFRDKAFNGTYETYKLAMALYAGKIIGAPNAAGQQMLADLLDMQTQEGGFRTHYQDQETPAGDANTETTSWALLALNETGCPGQ